MSSAAQEENEATDPVVAERAPKDCDLEICYILTHYPRVALTFISGEIDELEARGLRVRPIVMNRPSAAERSSIDAQRREANSIYLKGQFAALLAALLLTFLRHPLALTKLALFAVRSARFDMALIVRRLAHLTYAAFAARHCRAKGIRHLHAHFGQAPATIAWFAAEIVKFEKGREASWSFTIHGFQDFVDEALARLDLKARSAKFVICVSDFTKSQLCRTSDPAFWSRFHVVRCGIDLELFAARAASPSRTVPTILVVGRLSPEKGHLTLVQALHLLSAQGWRCNLEIVGCGPFEQMIRQEVVRLGLEDQVRFLGELSPEDVRSRLNSADIFCMPSFAEGLPISIMEAMAVGVPVVTTWISGIPELAENGVTALTVPPGNSSALTKAIRRLLTQPGIAKELIKQARTRVELMHCRKKNADLLLGLLCQNIDTTGSGERL